MPERVRIADVAPRDGLQNEAAVVPADDKIRLVRLLAESGVDEVEVTSFVSPKWVPQLADAEEVLGGLGSWVLGLEGQTPPPSGRGLGGGTPEAPDPRLLPLHPDDHHRRDPTAVERAKELRKTMTKPEIALWNQLKRDRRGGLRFRRQHPIGPYIADFCCPDARLVVEIDGASHEEPKSVVHDRERDRWLRANGYEVIRFSNDVVLHRAPGVAEEIEKAAKARVEALRRERGSRPTDATGVPPPNPLPRGGGAGWPLPGGGGVSCVFSALVPNDKGFERALAVHRGGLPLKIALFTAASETFNKRNVNASIAESIERFRPIVPRAAEAGMAVRVYVSCAVACPFEGAVAPGKVRRVVEQALALWPDDEARSAVDVDLGDTIGVARPGDVEALLREFSREMRERQITLHLHDTFGRAAECARAGLDMGVKSFDGAAGGLGGCPFASKGGGRAPGNIATERLVETVHRAGFTTGVDADRLAKAGEFAREIVRNAGRRA